MRSTNVPNQGEDRDMVDVNFLSLGIEARNLEVGEYGDIPTPDMNAISVRDAKMRKDGKVVDKDGKVIIEKLLSMPKRLEKQIREMNYKEK